MRPLLNDGVQPGEQEVETGTLVRVLAHACGGHHSEGLNEVGLDPWGGLKVKILDAPSRFTGTCGEDRGEGRG